MTIGRSAQQPFKVALVRLGMVLALPGLAVSCVSSKISPHDPVRMPRTINDKQATAATESDLRRALLDSHNAERARKHLPPLVLSLQLNRAAQSHAQEMALRRKMTHRGRDGSSPFERIKQVDYSFQAAGENVAAGFDSTDEVMEGWMRSPGHRRNILGDYAEIGLGRAIAPSGIPYWCAVFGTPQAQSFR